MSARPRIFISAVSKELHSARQLVANTLSFLGYEPVWQDIFGTEHGDLREVLRRKIDGCEGFIQLVGQRFGFSPTDPANDENAVSYTQFELLHARETGKKVWPILLADDFPTDRPNDEAAPRLALQQRYRQRLQAGGDLYQSAAAPADIESIILKLRDELALLRKEFHDWQRAVLRFAAAVLVLTGIVLGVVWGVKKRQDTVVAGQKEIVQGQKEIIAGPKITTAGIRKQILQGSERKRDRDLAEADKAESLKREKLREAALAAHEARIARIDELALSFAEIEGRADATAVFREMTRILEQEGVDFALAYVAEQKTGILDRIRKRKESEQKQTRMELQPLLSAAQLQAAAGQSVTARASYRQIIDLDTSWTAALDAFAWFLRDQSHQSERHGSLRDAVADAEEAHTLATRLHNADSTNSATQRLLAATHFQMAAVLVARGQAGDAEKVASHYTRSLEICKSLLKTSPGSAPQTMRNVSTILYKLGDFVAQRGQAGDADKALKFYSNSLEVAEQLLRKDPGSAQPARDVCASLVRLGEFLARRGQTGGLEQALGYFTRSLELREELLKTNPGSVEAARDVAESLELLGYFLARRGHEGDADKALGCLTRNLEISEALLKTNPGSAEATRDVSLSLEKLGRVLARRGQQGDAEKALGYLTRCNELLEVLLKANPGSAEAASDVSLSLDRLGDFLDEHGKPDDAQKIIGYYTRSLALREALLKANSRSARTAHSVSVSLSNLGDFLARRGQAGDAEKALGYFTRDLEISEALLKANPDSAEAAQSVWKSCGRLARHAERTGKGDAMQWYRRAYTILAGMKEKGQFISPADLETLEHLRKKVGE